MNKTILIGNLGKDPEFKDVGQSKLCKFSVATQDSIKREGRWEKVTDWHNVVVWGGQAENCAKFLRKGSKVAIEGKLKTRTWDQDGQKRYVTEVIANSVEFLDPKRQQQQELPQTQRGGYGVAEYDDIPF
jgi:single-strand DNA-binding protein